MKANSIRVFIGYDRSEIAAFNVLAHSILEHASMPVSITPVMLTQLAGVYNRPQHALASTEFSFSRFLVPWMCNFEGHAIFMDCDMLCRADIAELWSLRSPSRVIQVVKHDYQPESSVKFNNNIQTRYHRKNWSSVMLMNCSKCTVLSPEYVNAATGLELHQFKWIDDDALIGALPHGWNHLVGYDRHAADARLVHFTEGGPYFESYSECEYSEEWKSARDRMLSVSDRERLTVVA